MNIIPALVHLFEESGHRQIQPLSGWYYSSGVPLTLSFTINHVLITQSDDLIKVMYEDGHYQAFDIADPDLISQIVRLVGRPKAK